MNQLKAAHQKPVMRMHFLTPALTLSRSKHWQQDSTGDGLCPLGCTVTGSLSHILCQCQKAIKEEPPSHTAWTHDSVLLAIYKSVKDCIKEAMVSRVVAEVEDSIGFKSNLAKFTEHMGTPCTGGHFGETWVLGDMSDCWSVVQHKRKSKLASCGTPSFPEGIVLHVNFPTDFKHRTSQQLGWYDTPVMPDRRPAMGDSTVHSDSVIVAVSERQGDGTLQSQLNTSSASLTVHSDNIGGLRRKGAVD